MESSSAEIITLNGFNHNNVEHARNLVLLGTGESF